MADYSRQRDNAYASIERKGGKITFIHLDPAGLPTDPDYPWEGSNDEGTEFDHIGVIVPLGEISNREANPFSEAALIPAKGLPWRIVPGMRFKTTKNTYEIVEAIALRPDGETDILYTCEVVAWQAT